MNEQLNDLYQAFKPYGHLWVEYDNTRKSNKENKAYRLYRDEDIVTDEFIAYLKKFVSRYIAAYERCGKMTALELIESL